ncbi:MAG: EAL domain-containing protein, partial [Acidimicrobiales bacterium]|nr:EAL domain-containing protein [Acidimicrobiales bacterium]
MTQASGRSTGLPGPTTITGRQLGAFLAHIDAVVLAIDLSGTITFVSPSVRLTLGYEPNLIVGRPVIEFMHPDEEHIFHEHWEFATDHQRPSTQPTIRVRNSEGTWVEMTLDLYGGDDIGDLGALVATIRPLSGISTAEVELRDRLAREDRLVRLASTFVGLDVDHFDDGVRATLAQIGAVPGVDRCTVLRRQGDEFVLTHQWCGPRVKPSDRDRIPARWFQGVFGADHRSEMYFDLPEVVPPLPATPTAGAAGLHEMADYGIRSTVGVPLIQDGELAGVLTFGSAEVGPLRDSGCLSLLRSAAGLLNEAFARHDAEVKLAERARVDLLTGLDNRWTFLDEVERSLDRFKGGESAGVGVLLIDLDRFKVVNDSLGHLAGDQVLAAVAKRLKDAAGPTERLGRLGGDEMVVLLEDRDDVELPRARSLELLDTFGEPFEVDGHEFQISASAGLALATPTSTPEEILSQADSAMFRAKDLGRSRLVTFDGELRRQLSERLRRENEVRRAVRTGELTLHYQPELHLPSGRLHGVEALVRWNHPTEGLVVAGDFIDIAEETGLIVELGEWVLRQACEQSAAWSEVGFDLVMRVNISAKQVNHPDLFGSLVTILDQTGADPESLCLELTETAVMADADLSLEVLGKIAALGVQLAIDDFGTGYSSLSYLKRLPMHVLKVDRSFIDGLDRSLDDVAIVEAVISLASTLGLTVTAEGIESEDQLAVLKDLGCPYGQGWLFSKAVSAE